MRSRTVSLPAACWRSILSAPPSRRAIRSRSRSSSSSGSQVIAFSASSKVIDNGKENPYIKRFAQTEAIMITSKLTSKAQTTIPSPVRAALRLAVGDEIVYTIDGDRVILTKAEGAGEDPFATFGDWASEADR